MAIAHFLRATRTNKIEDFVSRTKAVVYLTVNPAAPQQNGFVMPGLVVALTKPKILF